jgi:predicted kinase
MIYPLNYFEPNSTQREFDMFLLVFSGPPGCGKSSLASALASKYAIPLFCRDHIQSFLYQRKLITENSVDGYLWVLEQARIQLGFSVSCILDAVFPREEFRAQAERYAHEANAVFIPITCFCSDKALWRSRWLSRATSQHESHWMDFSWADVERIEAQFEPWRHENLIELDAIESHESNLRKLIQYVENYGLNAQYHT